MQRLWWISRLGFRRKNCFLCGLWNCPQLTRQGRYVDTCPFFWGEIMSINITLDSRYKIQSDTRQWILVEDDRMVEFWVDLGGLIQSYFKRKLKTSEAKTISQLLEYHKTCLSALQRALAPLQIRIEGENSLVRPKDFKMPKQMTLEVREDAS